jgi:hypothetical protein
MKSIVYYLSFILFVALFSCHDADFSVEPIKPDYSYFPVDSGRWSEFKVKEINIDAPLNIYDTLEYYVRYQLSGIFIDNQGDTLIKVLRYYRDNEADRWQPINTWLLGIYDNMAIEEEENIRYIKLRFPLTIGKQWNGNAYNRTDTLQLFNYEVKSLDEPFVLNDISCDSVLLISQKSESTAISKIDFYERYAKHIGLIQKQEIDIRSEVLDDLSIPVENRVTQGTFYYQNLIRYGD